MAESTLYTVGGTVQAGGGLYIKRKADDELLGLCRKGEWASVLSSRQVGKSSLMVRTAQQLEKENICSVIIDLSAIGVNISSDQWYLGILNEIVNGLRLEANIFEWWEEHKKLGPTQRLTNFFRDVLLKEIKDRTVLFFDEIDSTLSMPFSRDDFFAALRAIYNARSTTPDFMRLSFVLIGVATPSDLIMDRKRTPYNIGRQVELTDFTIEEAQPLAAGLGINGKVVLAWIFEWTGGHPYLTQLICAYMAKSGESFAKEAVCDVVGLLFDGEQGRQDNNLRFVRDMLTKRAPNVERVLKTYKDIRSGKSVLDDERSVVKAHLKISGVVRRQDGLLVPRNRIYENAFDLNWTRENIPPQMSHRIAIASSLLAIMIMTMLVLTGQLDPFIYRPLQMDYILIPAGGFLMGSENPGEDPIQTVYLDTYWIGRYEVTNKQYYQCVRAGFCSVVPRNDNYAAPESENYPVTDVNWFEAERFCEWNDGRLPTEAEWEKAARGTDGRAYPWGEILDCSLANFGGCSSGLSKVGSYINGASPYGVYDMVGNVSEWVSSLYVPYPFNTNDGREDQNASGNRVQRGGSSVDSESFVYSAYRVGVDPRSSDNRTGFRCARSE